MGCIVKTFIYQVSLTFLLRVSNDFIHLKLFLFFHTGVPLPWNGPALAGQSVRGPPEG